MLSSRHGDDDADADADADAVADATTFRLDLPSATLCTVLAKLREQLDSLANASAGLMHTNMIVFEEPPETRNQRRTRGFESERLGAEVRGRKEHKTRTRNRTQGVLQKVGELGVAVRYMVGPVLQCDEHLPQCRQGLVHVLCLLQTVASLKLSGSGHQHQASETR
jgi:hypothetical protein